MSDIRSEFTSEDSKYYYGNIKRGSTADGVECPYCGFMFIILGTDDIKHHEFKPIPLTYTVDYFCPCCGKNLKEHIKHSLAS